MSKIDEYKEQKVTTDIVENELTPMLDADDDNGLCGFYERSVGQGESQYYFRVARGYCGYSHGCQYITTEVSDYILKALNYYKKDIVKKAIELAARDKQKALEECKKEAEDILAELNKME